MALVVTNIAPALWYQPFTGPSAIERSKSGAARAELVYYVNGGFWPGAGANNDKELDLTITLPKSYGYVLTDMSAQLTNDTGEVLAQNIALVRVQPDDSATGPGSHWTVLEAPPYNPPAAYGLAGNVTLSTLTELRNSFMVVQDSPDVQFTKKIYNIKQKPTFLIYPWKNTTENSSTTISFFDNVDQAPGYTVQFQARFLQFDVNQGYDYVLQSPLLVRP